MIKEINFSYRPLPQCFELFFNVDCIEPFQNKTFFSVIVP